MSEISISSLANLVNCVKALALSADKEDEILEGFDAILEPFERVLKKLQTKEHCPKCGYSLYKSDLPHYDYVCPECNENF